MPGFIGRTNTLTWGGVTLAGVREKSLKINHEPVDETAGEDAGWRTLLALPGEKTVDIDLSGIVRSKTLLTDLGAVNTQKALVYTRADGLVISGTFMLVSCGQTDPYKDATSYDASFQSTGAVTITP